MLCDNIIFQLFNPTDERALDNNRYGNNDLHVNITRQSNGSIIIGFSVISIWQNRANFFPFLMAYCGHFLRPQ